MTRENTSTRRRFLKSGALLAAPVAAVAFPAAALAEESLKARVERLESEIAIRRLNHAWLRQVNAGESGALPDAAMRRIVMDHAGAPEKIEIAADGRSAVGRFDCAVEVDAPLAADCTLAQMARAQGSGTVRRSERRMLTIDYANVGGTWTIARVAASRR